MKFSFVIPTYNRADELMECLSSIGELDFEPENVEVVIIDDASTDHTYESIQKLKETFPFAIQYQKQNKEGPSAARNRGIKLAKGDYIIFIDSDVTLPRNYLKKIAKELEKNPVEAFGGPDAALEHFPPLLKAIDFAMNSFLTTGGIRGKKGKKLAKYHPRTFNMGIRKDFALKIGGFLDMHPGEDIEYSHRIYRFGGNVLYIDSPVFHKRRSTIPLFFKQVYKFGKARILLSTIDKKLLEPLHALPALATLFTIFILVLHILFPSIRPVTTMFLYLILFYFGIISLAGMIRYKSPIVGLYLLIIAPIQIYGYGIGFIFQFLRRLFLKEKIKTNDVLYE
jgi:glycosyltransferase involved in cell wall biosynthesis